MQVINNSVDLKHIDQAIKEVGVSEIDKNFPTIIACGRLTRPKNYPFLLRSFAKVQSQISAKLLILGQGEEKTSLEQYSWFLVQTNFSLC